jgi:copper chaperone CopZ
MATATIIVQGMSCQHCVDAVTRELSAVPGVTGVTVELESGSVTVTSDRTLAPNEMVTAVESAGYSLA